MASHVDSLFQWCSHACSVVTSKIDEILTIEPSTPTVDDLNTVDADPNSHIVDTDHEDLNNHIVDNDHGDLNSHAVDSEHGYADDSTVVSDMTITESNGGVSINETRETFAMTDIQAVSEAPSTPISSITSPTDEEDAPERESTDESGSVALEENPVILNESVNQSDLGDDYEEISIPNSVKKVMVNVKISGESFFINKDLLCSKSSYFKAALNGAFMEVRTNEVELLEGRLDLFRVFHYWLDECHLDFMDAQKDLTAFIKIYSFADYIGAPDLCNLVIYKLDKRIRPGGLPGRLDVKMIKMAWENVPHTSDLCRYLVAVEHDADRCNIPKRLGAEYDHLPGDFIAALLQITEADADYWLVSEVRKQPIDMAKLHEHIMFYGGLAAVDRLRKMDRIISMMGIEKPESYNKERLRGAVRGMYRRWMLPWNTKLSPVQWKVAVEQCPRPVAKDFFYNAVPIKKKRLIPAPRY